MAGHNFTGCYYIWCCPWAYPSGTDCAEQIINADKLMFSFIDLCKVHLRFTKISTLEYQKNGEGVGGNN